MTYRLLILFMTSLGIGLALNSFTSTFSTLNPKLVKIFQK